MIKKLVSIFALPFGLFCVQLVMVFLGFYERHPWLDIPMHVLGGVFITYSFSLAMTYFQERKILSELNVLSRSVFLFALTSTATVIWEFGEFTLDFFFDTVAQLSLEDTMLDMFLGIVGGTALIVFLARGEIKEYVKKDKTPE
ncbi:MAG: hypothetical protein ACYTDW_18990 [Planctomycetota bacterium]|jgi:hypothetical protein